MPESERGAWDGVVGVVSVAIQASIGATIVLVLLTDEDGTNSNP